MYDNINGWIIITFIFSVEHGQHEYSWNRLNLSNVYNHIYMNLMKTWKTYFWTMKLPCKLKENIIFYICNFKGNASAMKSITTMRKISSLPVSLHSQWSPTQRAQQWHNSTIPISSPVPSSSIEPEFVRNIMLSN